MQTKKQFIMISPVFGEITLTGVESWEEVPNYLFTEGWANMGKVKVVERTYQWISDVPQLIDTDYCDYDE